MRALVLLLLVLPHGACTPRAVITFFTSELNDAAVPPGNTTLVKQYGRRMVLHLGREMTAADEGWLRAALGGDGVVQSVEPDALVGFSGSGDVIPVLGAAAVSEPVPETTAVTEFVLNTANDSDKFLLKMLSNQSLAPAMPLPWNLNESEPYGLHLAVFRWRPRVNVTTVAVLDSGLAAAGVGAWRPVGGYDFISSPDYANDQTGRDADFTDPGDDGPGCEEPSWHGTRVASVIRQVDPGSRLLIVRVLGQCGTGFANDVTDAIVWAAGGAINGLETNTLPAEVIAMSFSGEGACPSFLQSAVSQAAALGAVLVAAAGNQAQDAAGFFPGNCPGVVSVGASTRRALVAPYSNFGPAVRLYAPGGDATDPIYTQTALGGRLVGSSSVGTSFAAPHVAGLLSLVLAAGGDLGGFLTNQTAPPCQGPEDAQSPNCRVDSLAASMNWTVRMQTYTCAPGSYSALDNTQSPPTRAAPSPSAP